MLAADARLLKLIGGGGRRAAFVDLLRDLVKKGDAEPGVEKAPKPPKAAKAAKHGKAPKVAKPPKKAKKKT
jgi:hypothetical protein